MRESKAVVIASELLRRGAVVVAYDPRAGPNFAPLVPGAAIAKSAPEALRGADACAIQAVWPEFRRLERKDFVLMAAPVVIDGRRLWRPSEVPEGIRYRRVG